MQHEDTAVALALETIDRTILDAIVAARPATFITLDRLFRTIDQLKTNIALQMQDAGIEMVVA